MKTILAGGAILIVVMAVLLVVMEPANAPTTDSLLPEPATTTESTERRLPLVETPPNNGEVKTATFKGKLEEVNTSCFADGECFVTVGGKHVTVIMGWSQETVGTIIGAPSIGDLENLIGKDIEVFAQELTDGKYTLHGNEEFYVKVLNSDGETLSTGQCVIGGCSSQLCTDVANEPMMSTCEYRPVYACYKTARCERQTSGQCGWTETKELKACIASDGQSAQ